MVAMYEGLSPESGRPAILVAERWYIDKRLGGLARFALAITFLNLIGHLWLGFEQSWITPFVALAAAYATELSAEFAQAKTENRKPRFSGSPGNLISFLLSAHISALAVGMLLFAAEQLWVVAFASSLAVASKWLFRISSNDKTRPHGRHFLNPSNFGITIVLLIFPSVGIAPPYMFTENTSGIVDWILPVLIICTGSLLNLKFTGRMVLILAWLIGFAMQAWIRSWINDSALIAGVVPMSGFAFVLFTFYMITDPATSPSKVSHQIIFGFSVAATYGLLMQLNIVFGLFYSLTIVTLIKGLSSFFSIKAPHSLNFSLSSINQQKLPSGRK